ncbi:MAG: hypothetical protein KC425_11505 [Anaerolineales bacterium]|nr:hypothetical protein [Anaerolineales bacterium]
MRRLILVAIIVLVVLAGFFFYETAVAPETVDAPPTATAYPCPQATPELLAVEPVTSPTDAASQIVTVTLGNGELITITSEAGEVGGTAVYPTELEIPLLPQTVHHLTVTGQVREVVQGDCTYGGYVLTTTTDVNGDPLVIERP